jgi:hypothetical protein
VSIPVFEWKLTINRWETLGKNNVLIHTTECVARVPIASTDRLIHTPQKKKRMANGL